MRIGINGRFVQHPNTGSGQYLRQLFAALSEHEGRHDYRLLVPPRWPIGSDSLAGERLLRLWWEQIGIVQRSRSEAVDLLHVPYFAPPLTQPIPTVVTIHDVITLILPEYRQTLMNQLYSGLVAVGARGAAAVIADSECSKRDIVRTLAIPEERLHVIPLGVDGTYRPVTDSAVVAAMVGRWGLGTDYLLYFGGFDVRKNVGRLIEAYGRLSKPLRRRHRLVLAGQPRFARPPLFPDPRRQLEALGLGDEVVITGEVTEEDKPALYSGAAIFVYPSLYEGFGIPVLEAMACGTPVITSNTSSLPEVAGDAAVLIDPMDVEELSSGMGALLEDPQGRAEWAERGLERARQFPWSRAAQATVAVYESIG